MSVELEPKVAEGLDALPAEPGEAGPAAEEAGTQINGTTAILGASLSAAAAAWMASGIFRDFTAHYVALAGVVIGAGIIYASWRWRQPALQYGVIVVALVVGAALMAPDAQGGSATLPGLVQEALHSGGILQPPIPFDPGWRLILVVLFALLSAGGCALGVRFRRPKLGVVVSAPITMGAALVQPSSGEIANTAIALVAVVVGLTLAYGSELGGPGSGSGFETRRLLRGGAMAAGLAVAVLALSEAGFLFPQPAPHNVIPPQKPQLPPPMPDQVLFTYKASRPVPLRLGVIDTYDQAQRAWLLPAYDPARLQRLQPPTRIPSSPKTAAGAISVTVQIVDETGHALPAVASPERVSGTDQVITYDPLTQSLGIADRPLFAGLTYTVVGAPIPTGKELQASPVAPRSMAHWLVAPTPPDQVVTLLSSCAQRAAQAGIADDAFDRLQCVRQGFYDKVIASGPGVPVDLPAYRVGQMLQGGTASPYEITAAEALLARWAGIPSRIGYGYYGGDPRKDGTYAVHPVHGSMWLEAWFAGYGWVPVVGVPPHAQPSLRQEQKNQLPIQATDQIQLIVWVPVLFPTVTLLFVFVRWWLAHVLPVALLVALVLAAYPWIFKLIRRRRRRRWAQGSLERRIAVAYAEFRDLARDLTIGDPAASPVGFLDHIQEDAKHEELAWLATRALWGDLRRDLQPEDAENAERLAASVGRRLDRAQPVLNRVMARIARSSLREPYSTQLPNFWVELERGVDVSALAHLFRRRRPVRLGRRTALGAAALLILLVSTGSAGVLAVQNRPVDRHLVPATLGAFTLNEEKVAEERYRQAGPDSLVSDGLVFSIHHGKAVYGSVEESVFKPQYYIDDINDESDFADCTDHPEDCPGHEILMGVQDSFGSGEFHRIYYRDQRAYVMDLADQRIYVWFPRGTETMMLLDLISAFNTDGSADAMFQGLVDYEQGQAAAPIPVPSLPPPSPPPVQSYGPGGASPSPGAMP